MISLIYVTYTTKTIAPVKWVYVENYKVFTILDIESLNKNKNSLWC